MPPECAPQAPVGERGWRPCRLLNRLPMAYRCCVRFWNKTRLSASARVTGLSFAFISSPRSKGRRSSLRERGAARRFSKSSTFFVRLACRLSRVKARRPSRFRQLKKPVVFHLGFQFSLGFAHEKRPAGINRGGRLRMLRFRRRYQNRVRTPDRSTQDKQPPARLEAHYAGHLRETANFRF
jgi:hypothetical protein